MVRSPGFGSIQRDLFALFRLAFAMPPPDGLSVPRRITRWIVLQKARRHPDKSGLRLLVRAQFQVLFHSHSWVLFAFPSRYLFSIDRTIYLDLEGGPPGFSQGFTCPDLLDNISYKVASLPVPDYHRLWCSFPTASGCNAISYFIPALVELDALSGLPTSVSEQTSLFGPCCIRNTIGRPLKVTYMSQPLYKHSSTNLFKLCSLKVYKVWALPDSLATTTGIFV